MSCFPFFFFLEEVGEVWQKVERSALLWDGMMHILRGIKQLDSSLINIQSFTISNYYEIMNIMELCLTNFTYFNNWVWI